MFAYCNNNPVLLQDTQGDSATIAGGIAGGTFGFFAALHSEATDDDEEGKEGIRWDKVWKCTLSSAAAGAAAGFVADVSIATWGVVPAIFISAAGGALASGANSVYTQCTLTDSFNIGKVVSDAILGGVTNGLCTGTSNILKPLEKGLNAGLRYARTQATTELMYGFSSFSKFLVEDLLPTAITGFGAWYGGMQYDLITR